jgi:hypothetical protein
MEPIRYGFTTKDGQRARIDLTQVRSILPSGFHTGYVKLILDGGHPVTVAGDAEGLNDLCVSYTRHPDAKAPDVVSSSMPAHELTLFRESRYGDVYAAKSAAHVIPMVDTYRGFEPESDAILPVCGGDVLTHCDTQKSKPAREWLSDVTSPGLVVPGSK